MYIKRQLHHQISTLALSSKRKAAEKQNNQLMYTTTVLPIQHIHKETIIL